MTSNSISGELREALSANSLMLMWSMRLCSELSTSGSDSGLIFFSLARLLGAIVVPSISSTMPDRSRIRPSLSSSDLGTPLL